MTLTYEKVFIVKGVMVTSKWNAILFHIHLLHILSCINKEESTHTT